jgi:hypothetical protein
LIEAKRMAGCAITHIGQSAKGYVVFSTRAAAPPDRHRAALQLRAAGYVFTHHVLDNGLRVRAWGHRKRPTSNLKMAQQVAKRMR